jgi:hypothetical protein
VEEQERRGWREHPLLKRLPLLVLVALGLWLWQALSAPERELVLRLEGPGWQRVRAVEVQVLAEGGELLRREERFFSGAPPGELVVQVELREGAYQVWVFAREPGQGSRPPVRERLQLGEEVRVERPVWLGSGG